MGVLWAQLLLQFFTDLFETLQTFSSWCEDVHVVWIWLLEYFLSLFPLCELSHFSTSVYRQWVPCERNSSYSFIPIFSKLCTPFLHGLKICMWFGYNPCINFCHFFHFVNFVIFWPQILWKFLDSGYLLNATLHTILYWSFFKLCTCFLHGLEMCMQFGYNHWIIFCHFFHFVNFYFLTADCMKVYRQWIPCKPNSLYNFILIFMQLCTSFFHGLKMCMWFEFNPGVNFCHFSTLLTHFSNFRRCDINFTEVLFFYVHVDLL